jgi:hypothetical protein
VGDGFARRNWAISCNPLREHEHGHCLPQVDRQLHGIDRINQFNSEQESTLPIRLFDREPF